MIARAGNARLPGAAPGGRSGPTRLRRFRPRAWGTHHTFAVAEIVTGYGFPESAIPRIVIAECVLVVLYLVPQTAVFGVIVMTGYLGGAVAAHLRIADTGRAAIPLVVGILAWGGLYLRDRRIRQLVPLRRSA